MAKSFKTRKTILTSVSVAFMAAVISLSVWYLGQPGLRIGIRGKAATTPTVIKIYPTQIGSNDGYKVDVKVNGVPYNGLLDYDLTTCKLKISPAVCTTKQDAWGSFTAVNGVVTIPPNLKLPEAYYLLRLKPRGSSISMFSNFDLQIIDNSPAYPGFTQSQTVIPLPPRGSYSILENKDASGNFLGYTRIDVETDTDPNLCGGDVWRYTKTSAGAYWNPGSGDVSVLRWCVREIPSSAGKVVKAINGKIYYYDAAADLAKIKVLYPNSLPFHQNALALLGGFSGSKEISPWDARADDDMPYHYLLYPFNRILPAGLSSTPITLVDTAIGHPMDNSDTSMDIWHVEMLAPKASNSLVTFRQVENGWANRFATKKWLLTEDWTFNSRGLFTQIQQWWDTPSRCWDPVYQCQSGNNKVTAKIIESYVPDSRPLTIKFRSGSSPETDYLQISNGTSYELIARQADGSKYSGFLELRFANGSQGIWRDINRRPIYVSNGSVVVPPAAYGSVTNYKTSFSARPYLTNSSVNSLVPTADWGTTGLIPNASSASFSNTVIQEIK